MLGSIRAPLVAFVAIAACRNPSPAPPAASSSSHGAGVAIERIAPHVYEGSAIAIARLDGRRVAFVADEDEDAVHTVDLDQRRAIARTPLVGRPARLLVTRHGLVVARRSMASLVVLRAAHATEPLSVSASIPTADEPVALAVSPANDDVVYVASGWGRTLQAFDLKTSKQLLSMPLAREPRALLVSASSKRAFVGYMSTGVIDVVDLELRDRRGLTVFRPPEVGFVDEVCGGKNTKPGWCTKAVPIPERTARQTFSLARVKTASGERYVAPHVLVGPGEPLAITTGYGVSNGFSPTVFDLAIVDDEAREVRTQSPRAHPGGCALPRASVFEERTHRLFVACLGSDVIGEVANVHLAKLGPHDDTFLPSTTAPQSFTRVEGGPSALALAPSRLPELAHVGDPLDRELVALRLFDRKVEIFPIASTPPIEPWQSAIASSSDGVAAPRIVIDLPHVAGLGPTEKEAKGRRLFHDAFDARISADHRACASCHPDGRDDGLTWPTPEGPRQTIFLAGRLSRGAPFGWNAKRSSLEAHIRTTLANLKGHGLDGESLEALVAYLVSMPPPPRTPRKLDAVEARGRELFVSSSTGCAGCHDPSSDYGDHAAHDVSSATPIDKHKAFLAPSLRFVEGSEPYFHDGRYRTLDELLTKASGTMGSTASLGPEDRAALVAYLRTL